MHTNLHHPDDETLAEFLDGRLSGDRREQLIAHLDSCPQCFELVAELGQFRSEEAVTLATTTSEASKKLDFPAQRTGIQPLRWLAVAAGVILAVSATTWFMGNGTGGRVTGLVATLAASPETLANHRRVQVDGAMGFSTRSREARAVLAGARLVEVAVGQRTTGSNQDIECSTFDDLVPDICRGTTTLETLQRRIEEAHGSKPVDLGIWIESARLAALTEDRPFLANHSPPLDLANPQVLSAAPRDREALAAAWSRYQERPETNPLDELASATERLLGVL